MVDGSSEAYGQDKFIEIIKVEIFSEVGILGQDFIT